jgi:hypothetical protein
LFSETFWGDAGMLFEIFPECELFGKTQLVGDFFYAHRGVA